jgi:predicted dehydrogenase
MPSRKVRWGIVSTAEIGVKKVIPGILKSAHSEVVALASRDLGRARSALDALGLSNARAYDSYDALLADEGIDAVYIPLPNHLHVPVTFAGQLTADAK